MNLTFSLEAWEDYLYWQKHNGKILKRINLIIKDINKMPFVRVLENLNSLKMLYRDIGPDV